MKPVKIVREELERYMAAHPDATYRDISAVFKTPKSAIYLHLKRWGIPYPKRIRTKFPRQKIIDYVSDHPDFTYQEVINIFGCSGQTICLLLKKHGIPRPKHPRLKYDRDAIESYLLDHPMADCHELARVFRGTRDGVHRALVRFGLIDSKPEQERKYFRETLEQWIKDHPDGTYVQMARAFKTNPSNMRGIVYKKKLPRLKNPNIKLSLGAVSSYISSHPDAGTREISEHFGCDINHARIYLKNHNLSYRKGNKEKYKITEIKRYLAEHPDATHKELRKAFKIPDSIKSAAFLFKKIGLPPLKPSGIKYDRPHVERYLLDHPDATIDDLAKHFKGTRKRAIIVLKKYGITLKP
jgi:hypothetical protein